jgi:hypothetical protein
MSQQRCGHQKRTQKLVLFKQAPANIVEGEFSDEGAEGLEPHIHVV